MMLNRLEHLVPARRFNTMYAVSKDGILRDLGSTTAMQMPYTILVIPCVYRFETQIQLRLGRLICVMKPCLYSGAKRDVR